MKPNRSDEQTMEMRELRESVRKAIFLSGNGFDLILIILSGFIEIIAISADGMPSL